MDRTLTVAGCLRLSSAILISTLMACAPKPYEPAQTASRSVGELDDQIAVARQKIGAATASLNDLVNNPQGDLRKQYDKFSAAVTDLEDSASKARERAQDMRANREKYVANWQQQADAIQDPELQQQAKARMASTEQEFEKLSTGLQSISAQFQPFMSNLKDLQRYLGNDLTQVGVKSVSGRAAKVDQQGQALQASLDKASTDLSTIQSALAPSMPQPEASGQAR
jgi:chromosome segregation ATPase